MPLRFSLLLFAIAAALPAAAAEPLAVRVDRLLKDAVESGLIPGAVLVIGHGGQVMYHQAYGYRVLVPQREPMTEDTVFDAASLTKVVATTPSIMKLFEAGKVRLDDPVTRYLPEFQGGKSDITVRLLMTHFSGMPPDLELKPKWSGYETGVMRALATKPVAAPGARFIYSDINYILLGEIVRRLSGQTLPEFAQAQIYGPLGMTDSRFQPPASWRGRIAATEIDEETGQPLRGVVHDPTARYMGGVAGHAGLFSTAADLARYCELWLQGGQAGGTRVFSQLTVQKFTEPGTPPDQPVLRATGWDMDSPFSSNRGELFPIGSFGHTGYTGTSLWIDPATDTYIVLLTNVVHPHHGHSLSSLRSRLATTVAAEYGLTTPRRVALTGYNETLAGAGVARVTARTAVTRTGLDVLAANGFRELQGRRIGLITNQTGIDRAGQRDVDLMRKAGVTVVRLYSPEHGLAGTADAAVASGRDEASGLPVESLYETNRRRLTAAQMADLDAVVFDLQDIGARFWTYSCTLLYAVEEAGKAKKPFWVLDRPNPVTGTHVEGPALEAPYLSFTGCYNVPLRHGLTFGELATMANAEQHWGTELHVVKMDNWQRGDWWDATSLPWVNPSPNMRSLNAALLYPGIAMIEASSVYSVGRGTDAPFEQVGAPWMDGGQVATALNTRWVPGVRAYPTRFRPTASHFAGQDIAGVRFVITDREAFDSTRLGVELAAVLRQLYPGRIDFNESRFLIANGAVLRGLTEGRDASVLWSAMGREAQAFAERRKPYLLY